MCMCTRTLTCGRLSLQMLTLLTFVEMCVYSSVTHVLIRDTCPHAQIGKDSSACPSPKTLSDSSSRAALSQPESIHL